MAGRKSLFVSAVNGELFICNSIAVLSVIVLAVTGCDRPHSAMNRVDSKPSLDLLRLSFDHSGCVIDTHTDEHLSLFTEDWIMTMTPISGQPLRNVKSALEGVVRRGGPTYRSDSISNPACHITIYRYLRGIEDGCYVAQGDYLVDLDGYCLVASVFSRNAGDLFDQNAIDRFFMSLELLEVPRAKAVPPAWKEYQQEREIDAPVAKFVLTMAPAPIMLGNYSKYLGLVQSSTFPSFTDSDYVHGGRLIGEEILEFYSKDDPTSVRVDVWTDRRPPSEAEVEEIYSGRLTATSSTVYVWSSDEPYSFSVDPGIHAVDIVRVNRGKYEATSFPDRERFKRDDLERYEIYLNAKVR